MPQSLKDLSGGFTVSGGSLAFLLPSGLGLREGLLPIGFGVLGFLRFTGFGFQRFQSYFGLAAGSSQRLLENLRAVPKKNSGPKRSESNVVVECHALSNPKDTGGRGDSVLQFQAMGWAQALSTERVGCSMM